ncbi:odorant receptor 47a-like isoform X2 [Diachasmimorpha longicaudata]|uniref:odorant receptor 47a-like isoform X2 n=1 Tax=Diachasmimorpha longicaudata TaxID=58733 RepID=UPI0030B8D46F
MIQFDKKERPLHLYFEHLLGGDIRTMQALGLYSMGSILKHDKPKWYFWEVIPVIMVIPGLCFGLACNMRNIFDIIKTDYMGFRLCAYRREFYQLIKTFQIYWNVQVSRNRITRDIVEIARLTRLFRIYYSTVVIIAFSGYVIQPIGQYFLSPSPKLNGTVEFTKTVYPARYPFILDSAPAFFLCVLLETVGMYFMMLHWLATDGVFAQITTHMSLHFQVISNRIRDICPSTTMSPLRTAIISKRLKTIIEDYLELFKHVRVLEELYDPIMFATVLINGLVLCTCLFSIEYSRGKNNWKDVEKNMVHAFGLALQTLMFCTCAERLNNEIAGIRQAIYDCPWTSFSSPIKYSILLIMTLNSREYVYSTYGFIQLNMPQVTLIFTAAVRYFTVLRNFG